MTQADTTVPQPDADELLARAGAGVRLAEQLGADEAEVYLWSGRNHHLMQSHTTRSFEESDRSGVSARVLKDGRLTFAKTSGLRDAEIEWAVRRAVRAAGLLPEDERERSFAQADPPARGPSKVHPALVDVDPDRLRELADQVHDAAYAAASPNHFRVRLTVNAGQFAVANSHEVATWDQHAHESFLIEARCNEGDIHKVASTFRAAREPLGGSHDLPAIAAEAVSRAQKATDTTELDGFVEEVVLDGPSAATLFDKIIPSLDGKAMAQDRSIFAGKVGEPIASPRLTISDRPFGPRGCRAQRVDDEGVPTAEVPLIEEGVLKTSLFDTLSAQAVDADPTGHGLRGLTGRYAGQPKARPVNAVIEPGDKPLDALIEGADDAVLLQDPTLGSFTVDPLSGEFSVVAPLAFRIQEGEVTDSLESTSFSGNLFEALGNIEGLGSDPTDYIRGSFPPMHLSGVTLAT